MNEINIRSMELGDIDGVLEVEQSSFSTPWSRNTFESEIDNNLAHYLVIDVNGKVVGYAGTWLILNEAHVTNIAILPEYRGKGLGKKLIEALMAYAKTYGADSMTLEVRVSNDMARKLYAQMGFEERGVRCGYYSDSQEDAIIMWRDKL